MGGGGGKLKVGKFTTGGKEGPLGKTQTLRHTDTHTDTQTHTQTHTHTHTH